MPGNPEVLALLEQLLDSDQTPEEVCRDRPDLLAEVKRRWREYRFIDAEIDALFPGKELLKKIEAGLDLPAEGAFKSTSVDLFDTPSTRLPAISGYEIESVLGHGGMGIVYKARHARLNRTVALKMLRSGPFAGPRELARFQLEAESIAGLSHENIVQVHDVGDWAGRPYLTMEYMEAGSLAQKIAGEQQPARSSAALICTLARAVQAAHDGGIVHRDLKPGNVLLSSSGIAKISDFGLARRLDGEAGPTLSGALLGTPSYMAPEQARGKSSTVGPAVDIYALGAILYEMLTGRPPFRAESASETVLEVISMEPLPPSRLNARVPRDLEIICLKCLRKEPERRYADAAALAQDLDRFLHGEAIEARPEGWWERLGRRIRRRPTLTAMLAAGVIMSVALAGGGTWLWWERTANDLAQSQLAGVERMRRDREFAKRLEDIRLNRTTVFEGTFESTRSLKANREIADAAYEAAFQEAGIAQVGEEAREIAEKLGSSGMRESLAAAIDDWAACSADQKRQRWLLSIAEPAGLDPTGLRRRLCDPAVNQDAKALSALAEEALAQTGSVRLLVFLAERVRDAGGDAVPILKRVEQEHVGDFWSNFILADMLFQQSRFADSIRYFQAAAALRPQAAVVHNYLGRALAHDGRYDESIVSLRRALAIDPTYAHAHSNLGLALRTRGQFTEALQHFEQAKRKAPQYGATASNLGVGLCDLGRYDEAVKEFQEALRLDAGMDLAHAGLADICERKGELNQAIEHYQAALRINPNSAAHHHRLGCVLIGERYVGPSRKGGPNDRDTRDWGLREEAIAKLGDQGAEKRLNDAMERFRAALRLDPKYAPALCAMGNAMRTKGRLVEAIGYFEKALAADPQNKRAHNGIANALEGMGRPAEAIEHLQKLVALDPQSSRLHYNLALLLGNNGRIEDAVASYRRALKLDPQFADCHGALGMALFNMGHFQEAKAEMEKCLDILPKSDKRRSKIKEEVRRTERFHDLQARLPELVQELIDGHEQLADTDEGLALAKLCHIRKEFAAEAYLYVEVFKLNPKLADNLNGSRRYHAACAAALAGCGKGADAARTKEAERVRWRKQALEWLQADILIWDDVVDGSKSDRLLARTLLTHWLTHGDLAGVRDRVELAKLPQAERLLWNKVWFDHDRLLSRAREVN